MRTILIVISCGLSAVGLAGCESVEQSPECSAFVECVGALDEAEGRQTDAQRFAAEGDCWGSPEGAELCDRACNKGLTWLREKQANLPSECAP